MAWMAQKSHPHSRDTVETQFCDSIRHILHSDRNSVPRPLSSPPNLLPAWTWRQINADKHQTLPWVELCRAAAWEHSCILIPSIQGCGQVLPAAVSAVNHQLCQDTESVSSFFFHYIVSCLILLWGSLIVFFFLVFLLLNMICKEATRE